MKYLALAYYDVSRFEALTAEQRQAIETRCPPFDAELRATGKLVLQGSLSPPEDGAVLRPRGQRPFVTDGPFIESNEQVGGVFIIEASSMEEAVEIAAKHPAARMGEEVGWGIELRELEFIEQFPADGEK